MESFQLSGFDFDLTFMKKKAHVKLVSYLVRGAMALCRELMSSEEYMICNAVRTRDKGIIKDLDKSNGQSLCYLNQFI